MRLKFCSLRKRHSCERPARPRQWRSFRAKVGRVASALSKWPLATSSRLSCTTCMASWICEFQVKDSQWKCLPSSQACQCGRLACCNATRSGCLVSGGTLDAACRNCLEGRAVQFLWSEEHPEALVEVLGEERCIFWTEESLTNTCSDGKKLVTNYINL